MNIKTEEIKYFEEGEKVPDDFVLVDEKDMTDKQKKEMRVSKYDSISKLGKIFTSNRKERRRLAKLWRSNKEEKK